MMVSLKRPAFQAPLFAVGSKDLRSGSLLCAPLVSTSIPVSASASISSVQSVHRVIVLGGTGRVGEATLTAWASIAEIPLEFCITGRRLERAKRVQARLQDKFNHKSCLYFTTAELDINNSDDLRATLSGFETVLHTAGPFQQRERPAEVLSSAIASGCENYIDVCDDLSHGRVAKDLFENARENGLRCWICTGIYPGLSNLFASQIVRLHASRGHVSRAQSVRFSYYTAGTGGIGATVLASTFLILSEEAIVFDPQGKKRSMPAASCPEVVDFQGKIGEKETYLLNLPETTSIREYLCDGEVVAKFSTDPPIWNWLLRLTARVVPSRILRQRKLMQSFSAFSLPVVRMVDKLSGSRTGIRVDVMFEDGIQGTRLYEHESLRDCVGIATASFANAMVSPISPKTPGVFYPEELDAVTSESIVANATKSAESHSITFDTCS